MDGQFFYNGILFLRPKSNSVSILHGLMALRLKLLRSGGLDSLSQELRLLSLKIVIIQIKLGLQKVWGIMDQSQGVSTSSLFKRNTQDQRPGPPSSSVSALQAEAYTLWSFSKGSQYNNSGLRLPQTNSKAGSSLQLRMAGLQTIQPQSGYGRSLSLRRHYVTHLKPDYQSQMAMGAMRLQSLCGSASYTIYNSYSSRHIPHMCYNHLIQPYSRPSRHHIENRLDFSAY